MPRSGVRLVCCFGSVLVSALLATSDAQSQEVVPELTCDGRAVSAIEIRSQEPTVYREAPGWARPILRFALTSRRTDSTAVRPFLLLAEGEECSEFLREESERLLRAQTYIADARVSALPDEGGGVRLLVETSDDVPLVAGARFRGAAPRALLLGNGNLAGKGMLVAAEWERGYAYREGFGVHFEHFHALGGPQAFGVHAVRGPNDELLEVSLTRPYQTSAQRVAWNVGASRNEQFLPFPRVGRSTISQEISRDLFGASIIGRLGGSSRRLLGGATLGYERLVPVGDGVIVSDSGFVDEPGALPAGRFTESRIARIGAVFGARWLEFSRLQVLDSLAGVQDVPSGLLLKVTGGYEIGSERQAVQGARSVDVRQPFLMGDAFVGAGWDRGFMGINLTLEGRRSPEGGWRDVVAGGQASWYRRATSRRTHAVSLEYSSTWNSSRPYRLTLDSWRDGVRGYAGSHVSGGRLAVLRLEERWSAGGFGELAGFGGALFTDMGKMWSGDVPFGYSTNLRVGVGAGLIVTVPRNSQAFYRLDIAAPLTRDRDAKSWSLRLSRQLAYRTFWRESGGISRARAARPEAGLIATP